MSAKTIANSGRYRLHFTGAAAAGLVSSALLALPAPKSRLIEMFDVLLVSQGCLIFLATVCLMGAVGYAAARRTGFLGEGAWVAGLVGVCFGVGADLGFAGARTVISGFTPVQVVTVLFIDAFVNTLMYGLLGIVAGVIGSAIGRKAFRAGQQSPQNAQNARM